MISSRSNEPIGVKLKRFRHRKRLMQEDAARLLGISQAYISRLESGNADPSKKLRAKLDELMHEPEHWSLLDHLKAMVSRSPHIAGLFSEKNGKVFVEAVSEPMKAHPDVFPAEFLGREARWDDAPEVQELVKDIVNEGSFEGHTAFVESVWSWPPTPTKPMTTHWRTMHTTLRDEDETWLAHTYHVQITAEEKREMIEKWGKNYFVQPFVEDQATPPLDEFRRSRA